MKIDVHYSPSCGAKFVTSAKLGRLAENGSKYVTEYASLVKIEPKNARDIDALENAIFYWEDEKFASNIFHAACAMRNDSKYYINHDVYALTSQKHIFEDLDDTKILGLIHLSPIANGTFIEHIQTKPELIYGNAPEYKGVGTAILNSIKRLTSKISCFPAKEKSAKDFYKKNGFVEYHQCYVWYKA